MPRGRKKVPAQKIAIRVNPGDKEYLDEKSELEGITISEICRHWISDRVLAERSMKANQKASELMDRFFGKVMEDMVKEGVPEAQIEQIFGLGSERDFAPQAKTRSSNTGSTVTKTVTTKNPSKLKKAS